MLTNTAEEFWGWFDLKRSGVSIREIERRAGAPRGRITNIYRKGEPSAIVCDSIAKGLGVEPTEVFRRAGLLKLKPEFPMPLLDPPITEEFDSDSKTLGAIDRVKEKILYELVALARKLPVDDQLELLQEAETRYSHHQKNEVGEDTVSEAVDDSSK